MGVQMGRQERLRKIDKPLRKAGLEILSGEVAGAALPLIAARVAAAGMGEFGGRGFGVPYGDPDLVERANQGWWDLAVSFRLLDGQREFLLALPAVTLSSRELKRRMRVGVSVPFAWYRVRLLDRWDVMGAGAASFLGMLAGYPEFLMQSLDGGVSIVGTTYETKIGCLATPEPCRTKVVRDHLQKVATIDFYGISPQERAEALAWLDRNPASD